MAVLYAIYFHETSKTINNRHRIKIKENHSFLICLWFSLEKISGGGWSAHSDNALDPFSGASLLEGARGGDNCFSSKEIGIHGQGGFGGGGGGCRTGGTIV